MATKAKATTKKRATAPAKKTTKSAAAAAPKTTVRAQKTTKTAPVSALLKPVFTPKTPLGAILAEFVGTFVLASLFLVGKGNLLYVLFGIIGITFATIKLSGAHFNPAISFAAWATRRISGWKLLAYIGAQVLGAMLALLVQQGLVPAQPTDVNAVLQGGTANAVYQIQELTKDKEWYFFFAQMLGGAILAYGFAAAWDAFKNSSSQVLAISFSYFTALAITAQYAVINPAVAIALGGVKWQIWPLAVFVAAPIIGAMIGAGIHKLFTNDVAALEA